MPSLGIEIGTSLLGDTQAQSERLVALLSEIPKPPSTPF
jgi:hypothetical protein